MLERRNTLSANEASINKWSGNMGVSSMTDIVLELIIVFHLFCFLVKLVSLNRIGEQVMGSKLRNIVYHAPTEGLSFCHGAI